MVKYTDEEIKIIKDLIKIYPNTKSEKLARYLMEIIPGRTVSALKNQVEKYRDPMLFSTGHKFR